MKAPVEPNTTPSRMANGWQAPDYDVKKSNGESASTTPWFLGKVHSCISSLLRAGGVPKHIAFIMDGNRRFARMKSLDLAKGHAIGFEKLRETLDWCRNLGVKMVTVYAFSLENFNRDKSEVEYLMDLAKVKFKNLMEEHDLIQTYGVCVRIIGDVSTLPPDLQRVIADMVLMSRDNTNMVLNVAFAYTSRHEITTAVKAVSEGVRSGKILESDISENLIERALFTDDANPPDLLVRTSGEVRLSDFLLWQSGYSCVFFTEVLWPEFSFWNFVDCVVHYQRNRGHIEKAQETYTSKQNFQHHPEDMDRSHERIQAFLDGLRSQRFAYFERIRREIR